MRASIVATVLIVACSNIETPSAIDGSVDDGDGQIRPERPDAAAVVLSCPDGHAIAGVVAGQPVCRPAGPDGLVPAWDGVFTSNNFSCPPGYEIDQLHFECGCSNNATWSACYRPADPVPGSSKYSPPDVADFECPLGSLLRGFDAAGQPLCRSDTTVPIGFGLSAYWDGNFTGNNFSCAVGYDLELQHFDCGCSNNATWAVCVRNASSESDHALAVTATSRTDLLSFTCDPGTLVTGFSQDDQPLCEAVATEVPAGFGINAMWDGNFTGNNFSCPNGFNGSQLHFECGCSNNTNWNACVVPTP